MHVGHTLSLSDHLFMYVSIYRTLSNCVYKMEFSEYVCVGVCLGLGLTSIHRCVEIETVYLS